MEPLATPTSLDLAPLHVIAVVLAAVVIGLIGVAVRRLLVASGLELGDLVGRVTSHITARVERRRMRSETPWICAQCRSHNRLGTTRCYRCGLRRQDAELHPPTGAAAAPATTPSRAHEGMRPRRPR
jgi:hypothetical protein